MASILLYDIDFLHSNVFVPNLELMKVFNYYNQRGDIVRLAGKKENFDLYKKIIYFKQNPNLTIPKSLKLSGEKVLLHGYGFNKNFSSLKEDINSLPPSYIIYDLNLKSNKKEKSYEDIKNNALVRIENNDITDIDACSKQLFIADYEPLRLPNFKNFIMNFYKDYKIKFCWNISVNSEKLFEEWFWLFSASGRRPIVNFKFSKDFFKKYYYEPIFFNMGKTEYDKNLSTLIERLITMILYAKSENKKISFLEKPISKTEIKKEPLLMLFSYLRKWGMSKTTDSFYKYYDVLNKEPKLYSLLEEYSKIRLLLKQNPQNFDNKNVDFWNKK